MDLRFFLTLGMLFSSLATYLFGVAKSLHIHNFWYFGFVQVRVNVYRFDGAHLRDMTFVRFLFETEGFDLPCPA
jgi:hypothetical protein